MTFRQVLAVIWQRKILVVATLLLVLGIAFAYLSLQAKVYSSSMTLRMSIPLTQTTNGGSGAYTGLAVDPDPLLIASPLVINLVPADTPAEVKDGLLGSVSGVLVEGNQANRVNITATASSPSVAQARVEVARTAYQAYITQQIDVAVQNLTSELKTQNTLFEEARKQLLQDPSDAAASNRQSTAAVAQVTLTTQLTQIKIAPPLFSVLTASEPGTLTSASPLTVLGVGFLSGLIAGMGAALIRDQFDDRLLSAEDAEEAIGEPVLGELAVDKGRKKNDLSVPTERRTNTAFNEGIRTLRTSLQVLAPQRHSMIVVTSPEPGEGKTFVTASLAVSLARAGRQVIIVSGDLRRPRLTRYFGVRESTGLADAITQESDLESLRGMLQPASQPGLMVLPHGSRAADPADLLATQAVGPVLSRLRQLADIVIIDSPPALALADAANLATHADGVLVISALHRTKRHTLTGTLRNLRANGVNVFGVVCNRSTDAVPKSYEATYLLDESNTLVEATVSPFDEVDHLDQPGPADGPGEDSDGAEAGPGPAAPTERSSGAEDQEPKDEEPTDGEPKGHDSKGHDAKGHDSKATGSNGHSTSGRGPLGRLNGSRRSTTDSDEFGVRR